MMNRAFLAVLALGLWANAAATIVHGAWTSTSALTAIDAKLGRMQESLAAIAATRPRP